MARFITLAGKKQVGKDTSAHMIKELLVPTSVRQVFESEHTGCMPAIFEEGPYAKRVHIVHFADALKQACNVIFGIPLRDMETEEGKRKLTHLYWPFRSALSWNPPGNPASTNRMTVREVLQFVGTELFRDQMHRDVWVDSVFRKPYRDDDIVLVADCRFPNEAEPALKHGILIKIERDTGLSGDSHASETALDDFSGYNYVVDNNGSLDDLKISLKEILEQEDIL